MKITVVREWFTLDCTIGQLLVDGVFECFTLEDMVRPESQKVFGKTAIPYGKYSVSITYSPHFKRMLPLLSGVPNFDGVRIHPGNYAADTEGCLLVGNQRVKGAVLDSRSAFNNLFGKISAAIAHKDTVTIEYMNGA
jgi:hypothetical protein